MIRDLKEARNAHYFHCTPPTSKPFDPNPYFTHHLLTILRELQARKQTNAQPSNILNHEAHFHVPRSLFGRRPGYHH
jgi:predicted phosphatase